MVIYCEGTAGVSITVFGLCLCCRLIFCGQEGILTKTPAGDNCGIK